MLQTNNALPMIVEEAMQTAKERAYQNSCLPEVGQLLRIFSGLKPNARVAEIGTGLGVGSAWILSGIEPNTTFFTVELERERVELVSKIFEGVPNVHVLQGDWKQILSYGPFDFAFVDAKSAKHEEADDLIDAMMVNGLILLDDFTPIEHWPEEWRGKPDVVREKWMNDERLFCTEVRTSESNSVLVARKIK
ncbi:O-methyltransferase [Alicyclobacillus acidiphilus]|uniref:O-methyltransferase n=1 Tax=Alicyclobacillus acidiphilus TaxID=182455 RepID=UPI0008327A4B|nr:class I SAM-dependent methyltransferase [Alicyclobacillus acidiphilus]